MSYIPTPALPDRPTGKVQRIIDALDGALERGGGTVSGNDLIGVRTALCALRAEERDADVLDALADLVGRHEWSSDLCSPVLDLIGAVRTIAPLEE